MSDIFAAEMQPKPSMADQPRMYIVFRADLPEMTRAKGEVQAAHAAASLIYMQAIVRRDVDLMRAYFFPGGPDDELGAVGQVKVIMEVDDEAALEKMISRADARAVEYVKVTDAGYTVFDKPTVTCVGFGPCSKTDGNAIMRGARMRA